MKNNEFRLTNESIYNLPIYPRSFGVLFIKNISSSIKYQGVSSIKYPASSIIKI